MLSKDYFFFLLSVDHHIVLSFEFYHKGALELFSLSNEYNLMQKLKKKRMNLSFLNVFMLMSICVAYEK